MIVLLVSTLKLSELTQLFSTSFISFRRFGANIMHFFFDRGSFCISNFSEITTNPRQKSNHLCNLSTQLTYATITYFLGTHLSFRLVVLPAVSILVARQKRDLIWQVGMLHCRHVLCLPCTTTSCPPRAST